MLDARSPRPGWWSLPPGPWLSSSSIGAELQLYINFCISGTWIMDIGLGLVLFSPMPSLMYAGYSESCWWSSTAGPWPSSASTRAKLLMYF